MTTFLLKFEFDLIKQNIGITLSLECPLTKLLLILNLSVKSTVWVKVLSISLIHSRLFVIYYRLVLVGGTVVGSLLW
jgi:hypothetical protein